MQVIDFSDYDYNEAYNCSPLTKCRHFNKLMYLLTRELNDGNGYSYDVLANYIVNNLTEINEANESGWTPLMIASRNSKKNNSIEIIKLLLENGSDPDVKDNDGWTALMLASRYSNTDSNLATVQLLLDKGADINTKDYYGQTALMMYMLIMTVSY